MDGGSLMPEPICPVCGAPLFPSRGKLVCPKCGYAETCCEGPIPSIEDRKGAESERQK
jgi:uncharacterized Zn finger protein (UPF0148 family)